MNQFEKKSQSDKKISLIKELKLHIIFYLLINQIFIITILSHY